MKKVFLALCLAAALVAPGCIKVDNSLGKGLVDKSLLFDTYTAEFPLEEIQLKSSEALSGPSADKALTCDEDSPLKNPYSSPLAATFVFCLYCFICLSQLDASAPYICNTCIARLSLFITAVHTKDKPVESV